MFRSIKKRDGRIVEFDAWKITNAIAKAGQATGEFGAAEAKRLSLKVLSLAESFIKDSIPCVEEIQDLVEEVLLASPYKKTAKAYIIYRDQHAKIRALVSKKNGDLMDRYLKKLDWQVNENSNMTYSLQGLNNYISAEITKTYWLHKIYPPEIRNAHLDGAFHIHDLSILSVYCVGWDLEDLLLEGFRGVPGKIESAPPKHFRSALGQLVNFFYTLQGEAAGAQAFSSIDTFLAPFIRYDSLSIRDVKQAMQEFVFNMNVPTRVGFQCVSQDTEILTPRGWTKYNELQVGDVISTFNVETGVIEEKPITHLFSQHYTGIMYNLRNRIQDQLISPGHRVVRKKFNTPNYTLEEIEQVRELKSPIIVPIAGQNQRPDVDEIFDEEIQLMAWIIADGTTGSSQHKHRHCGRITIYQSKVANEANYHEITDLLDALGLAYSEYISQGVLGQAVDRVRLTAEASRQIHTIMGVEENIKFIPSSFLNMSERQSRLFLETYLKADGFEGCKISTTHYEILEGLQQLCVNAGWGFTVLVREPTIGKKPIFVLRIIRHQDTYIQEIREINYDGVIWCPTTENNTVIAKRNDKVFITGNTPFTNITLDITPPPHLRDMSVIRGGEYQNETYGDFEEEIRLFNQAFLEIMKAGDAKGRVFTFPIPTYNMTNEMDWDNPDYDLLWEVTAKYGLPYFSNFVNSDMKPEDTRSMCCRLRLDTRELQKKGGGLFGANPLTGSIGVVTINLPRIGYLSRDDTEFYERLDSLMQLAKESLIIKRKILEGYTASNLYPYSKYYLRNVYERFGEYWKNHFSTIGLVGMNESLMNFMGETMATFEGRNFALNVLEYMRDRLVEFQEATGMQYNLEATPAEGTSYRLARLDRERYPTILSANSSRSSEPYYTNSTQLPVGFTDDIFEALDLQDDLQSKYTGGTVFHMFIGERIADPSAVKTLVKRICENYHLPYFTLTPTFSICKDHGYIAGEHSECPSCGKSCEVYSRVVGYIRPVNQWNLGKIEEFKERKTFKLLNTVEVV